jgi:hypothetical protein
MAYRSIFPESHFRTTTRSDFRLLRHGSLRELGSPRLLDLTMRNQTLDPYGPEAITSARGLVLEIGVGSGLNLSLYGPAADSVVGLDPRPEASTISPISTDHRFRRR